ncbi:MAG: FAD-binding oxidoreductase [Rhizobiaceae bacterium]|nr:FAD-binding oxidoreductase [Rhizobiaceae bacterium]
MTGAITGAITGTIPGTITADVVIVGAGMAGVGLAADLSRDHAVVLLEMESRPGYHSTGRSAAIFIQNYGNASIRALNRVSAAWYADPDPALFPTPLLSPRGCLFVADAKGLAKHRALMAEDEGLDEISPEEAVGLVPVLKRAPILAACYERTSSDIDVAALHQGWLKKAKASGATLLTDARVDGAARTGGTWQIATNGGTVEAPVLVNAAGAWADRVAAACGVAQVGLQPYRRSMAVLPSPDDASRRWPLFGDAADAWYCKPDGGKLLVSPSEEDPVEPHDAFADDMVLAEGLDRFQQAVTFPVTRVERSWAGLRSFAPDRTPVAGFDPSAEGFFWLAGQGGYGIQTAPGLSLLAGSLIRRTPPPRGLEPVVAALSPDRFRT